MTTFLDTLPNESDVDFFWRAGLRFATGVSVITLGSGTQARGVTVSAFTLVSRRPALISLCLPTSSGFADVLAAHGAFAVNILSRNQSDLARRFAGPARGDQFDGVAWTPGFGAEVPLLDGALCWLWCRFRRTVPAGDHQVVLAGMTGVRLGSGKPLLYFDGKLHPGVIEA